MVQQMSLSSTEYAKHVNEFEKAGFTMLPSDTIAPFRVAESPVQFECKVNQLISLGNEGGAGNLIICQVLKLHINEDILDANKVIIQEKLDLVSRAGGSYYSRAKNGFFEIPKPLTTLGIGIDQIPNEIKESTVLTGNNLGMLGNVDTLPTESDVNNFAEDNPQYIGIKSVEKHKFAQFFLEKNDAVSAWKVLLIKN